MAQLHAVYASDDNYAPYMGISMYSLLANNSKYFDRIHIYVLDNGIKKKNCSLLKKQANVFDNVVLSFHNVSCKIDEIKPKHETGWSSSIFGRYFIDDIIEDGVDKILYLDCDTIVNNPLNELIDIDVSDYYAAGVTDGLTCQQKEYLGLADDWKYVNSGVLLINVGKWKKDGICERLVKYVNSFDRKLIYPDQDAFNAVCGCKLFLLPLKYNFFLTMDLDYVETYVAKDNPPYTYDEVMEAMVNYYANTVIFHFTGEKPWNKFESSPNFEKIFKQYAKQSCWNHIKPKFRDMSVAMNYYRFKVTVGAYELARRIFGDKFYNAVKRKFKDSEE